VGTTAYRARVLRWLLNTFPSWALMVLVTAACVAIGLAAERWQHRRRGTTGPRENQEVLSTTFEFVGIAYAILIGFVIVSLWESQQEARQLVSAEAAALDDMAVLAHGFEGADRNAIDDAIERYVTSVAEVEFDAMKDGDHSEATDDVESELLDVMLGVTPETDLQVDLQSKMIDSYNELTNVRTERLAAAQDKLAGELWILVLGASVAMILLMAAFESEDRWHVWGTTMISVTIGLVLFAMVALSYPFSGQVSVPPSSLENVVLELDR
jgi:hypothetical protein